MVIAKEKEAEVLRLYHGEKWPVGTIAAQLGLHHTTVQRVLGQSGVDPKVVAPRPSMVDPFVPFIVEQLGKYPSLRSSRLFGMLKERGYPGGPDHLRRVIRRLRPEKPAEAFQRLRTLPGEQAQVDWAHFGKLAVGRALRPLWAFVMVLSYSRRIFLRFFPSAAMPFFVRGHVEAFADIDGVPRVLLYDNLKSAVVERHGDAIRFHPMLLALSAHYRFEPRPVAVARGNEKGRVERAIRYVREAFFEARTYADLDDLNRQATEWTSSAALDRSWVEDRARTVRQAFDDERSVLLSLPDTPFPAHERVEVEVGKTPYARFDLNDYSVPHDRTSRTLVVLADLEQVRIADGNEIVATHVRSWDRGQQIEQPVHIQRLVDEKRRAREHRGLDRLARAARSSQAFLRILAERGDNVGSAIARLLHLLDAVGAAELEEALVEVLERDTIHVGAVRQVIDRRRSERHLPPPISIPVTRGQHAALVVTPHSLATYDALKKDPTP
ncbi:IS21 family transposase [Sorangium sp. So ce145]|uniref:IS21 family transposase n=1 Tax=Sorangium sp. So ce145 TaxID=3133285 RepID=UPI003F6286F3